MLSRSNSSLLNPVRLPPIIDGNRASTRVSNTQQDRVRPDSLQKQKVEASDLLHYSDLKDVSDSVNYMIGDVYDSLSTANSSRKIDRDDPQLQKMYSQLDEWEKQKDQHEIRYKEILHELDVLRGVPTAQKEPQKPDPTENTKHNPPPRVQPSRQRKVDSHQTLKPQSKMDKQIDNLRKMVSDYLF